ncbi:MULTISPECIES: AAA family ATPase [Methanobacterium]|jgi:CO dehydrogenase maturation factor|uniref:AAA family ATPase n=1 Tax=Methanobacterium veterum TaxID=408577 RepID=A0A9E4ZV47_9EURY|nr:MULTISPECIES: AAA family ATPase [Methanobacterium]MCZ3365581.1 AAA family ATPase [Methanobacterium veterum]MCZ3371044.1 AAA family ATPase [Methanobacterium veterum]
MPKIVVSGRGGCGKSTLVTLMAKELKEQGKTVLVVDSDESNLGLGTMLGFKPAEKTLMDYLGGKPAVMDKLMAQIKEEKNEHAEFFMENSDLNSLSPEFVKWNGDLALMQVGKIEHTMEGCACPMGAIARDFLNHLAVEEDQWVLIDTEAGVEHFGRGIVEGADSVLMVVDPSNDAVLLTEKAAKLTEEAGKNFAVVLNKVDGKTTSILEEMLTLKNITIKGILPYSSTLAHINLQGESLDMPSAIGELDKLITGIT